MKTKKLFNIKKIKRTIWVTWYCPICKKKKRTTLSMSHRKTCSKECGQISRTKKISKILKEKYASGELDWLRKKQKITGTNNLILYNKSDKGRKKSSEVVTKRNLKNNPTKNKKVCKKISNSHLLLYSSGKLIPHDNKPYNFHNGNYIDRTGKSHYYGSSWELKRMQFLDNCKNINWKKLNGEYRIPYTFKNKKRTYFPDFEIKHKNKIIIEEIGDGKKKNNRKLKNPLSVTALSRKKKRVKIKAALKYFKNRPETFVALGRKQLNERTW
jgi:endogenous inhibitor of DNA gyrase (YacG/DUF329 family)